MKTIVRKLVAEARRAAATPRVHPNGFIQLDLEDDGTRIAATRLHVWPDGNDIPKQDVATIVHDHRFDMHSTVLRGTLIQQRIYKVDLSPLEEPWTHQIYVARYPGDRKESVLEPTGIQVTIRECEIARVEVGQSYRQPRYTFHATDWKGLTATVIAKEGEDVSHDPRVLVPVGLAPDNGFVRANVDIDLLWDYIDRALNE